MQTIAMLKRKVIVPIAAVAALLAGDPAWSQVTVNDLQITGRALGFLEKPLTGEVSMGIIYMPDSPQSTREAESVRRMLGNGFKVGNVTLRPVLIPADEIARARVELLFLAPGTGPDTKALAEAIRSKRVPCITTDVSQVRNGTCTVGVRSQPKVEILVNRSLAANSSTTFSSVFRMMITEI